MTAAEFRPPLNEEMERYLEGEIKLLHAEQDRTSKDMCEIKDDVKELKDDVQSIKTDVALIKKSTDAYSKWIWLAAGAITISGLNAIWQLIAP